MIVLPSMRQAIWVVLLALSVGCSDSSNSDGPSETDEGDETQGRGSDGTSTAPAEATAEGTDSEGANGSDGPSGDGMTRVYILFGQSNMYGVPPPEAEDMGTNPRVEVLTLESCGAHGVNEWVIAQPPLHGCVGNAPGGNFGPGIGPGDYFARTLVEAYPNDTILLVPNSIPGVSINCFAPADSGLTDASQFCTAEGAAGSVYESMLARAMMAQSRGEISGIIFHQGETDTGQADWPERVAMVVDRLRSDLGIGDVPFLAGELSEQGAACCGTGHNPVLRQLPQALTNAHVVEAADLPIWTVDPYHFSVPSQRTLGIRYGERMLEVD